MDIPQDIIEKPFKFLIIRDFSDNLIRYELLRSSLVNELVDFLSKIPMECFFQAYKLEIEKTGKRLYPEDNLFTLGLQDFDIIKMTPNYYDYTSAKDHFNAVKYILNEHPNFLDFDFFEYSNYIFRDYDTLVEDSQKLLNVSNVERAPTYLRYLLEEPKKEENADDKEKEKKEKNAKPQTEKKTKEKEDDNLEAIRQYVMDADYKKINVSNIPNSVIYENNQKPIKFRCLNSLYLSSLNSKIEANEAPSGDILYIEAITLENNHLFITCNEKGFFVNNSKVTVYDPTPLNSTICYTLPGLLSSISNTFKESFTKTICQTITKEEYLLFPIPADKNSWLTPIENPFYYEYRYKSLKGSNLDSVVGIQYHKEWNEEYQGILNLDLKFTEGFVDTRERFLVPFYNNFRSIALEGAKLIANKKIKPYNIENSASNAGYYIYGNIFITQLEDSTSTCTFNKETQSQTIYGASADLRHINMLNKVRYELGIKDLFFGLCFMITYKGMTLHAQVMTPGIIFNSEHLIVYGEYDDSKIRLNENFRDEIKPTMESIGLVPTNIVIPESEGNPETVYNDYYGHPEMKGVKGVDKRNYLFDLVHLMPRDLNFDEPNSLIRPELLVDYKMKLMIQRFNQPEVKEHIGKIQTKIDEVIKSTGKTQKEMIKEIEELSEQKEKYWANIEKEIRSEIKLNVVYKTEYAIKDAKEEEIKILESLASHVLNESIPKFLKDCSTEDDKLPGDSDSLKKCMHKYGISSRYFSTLVKKIDDDTNTAKSLIWLKHLIFREALVKSARSIFNEILKETPSGSSHAFAAYFLNIFLGHPNLIKALDYFNVSYSGNSFKFTKPEQLSKTNSGENSPVNSKTVTNKDHDKKKKRRKKNKGGNKPDIDIDLKYFITENLIGSSVCCPIENKADNFFIKPSEIWSKIITYAKEKYRLDITSISNNQFEYIDQNYNKLGMLRDFCKKVGLSIEANDYKFPMDFTFIKTELLKPQSLIFNPENIIDFFPVYKDYLLPSEVIKPMVDEAESYFEQGALVTAAERYKQCIFLSGDICGGINKISANCHKKLAHIAFYEGDAKSAVVLAKKAIIIYEKLCEFDSPELSNCYSDLSTYYNHTNDLMNSFKAIYKSWEITNMVYPKNVSLVYINLAS